MLRVEPPSFVSNETRVQLNFQPDENSLFVEWFWHKNLPPPSWLTTTNLLETGSVLTLGWLSLRLKGCHGFHPGLFSLLLSSLLIVFQLSAITLQLTNTILSNEITFSSSTDIEAPNIISISFFFIHSKPQCMLKSCTQSIHLLCQSSSFEGVNSFLFCIQPLYPQGYQKILFLERKNDNYSCC